MLGSCLAVMMESLCRTMRKRRQRLLCVTNSSAQRLMWIQQDWRSWTTQWSKKQPHDTCKVCDLVRSSAVTDEEEQITDSVCLGPQKFACGDG